MTLHRLFRLGPVMRISINREKLHFFELYHRHFLSFFGLRMRYTPCKSNEGNRRVVRPRGIHGGRGGLSSGSGNGDPFAGDHAKDLEEGMDELQLLSISYALICKNVFALLYNILFATFLIEFWNPGAARSEVETFGSISPDLRFQRHEDGRLSQRMKL
ncbi:hypothetical protein Tco_0997211 [Tanacetum coccineum]